MKNLSEETVNIHLKLTEFLLKTVPDIFILSSFLPSQGDHIISVALVKTRVFNSCLTVLNTPSNTESSKLEETFKVIQPSPQHQHNHP